MKRSRHWARSRVLVGALVVAGLTAGCSGSDDADALGTSLSPIPSVSASATASGSPRESSPSSGSASPAPSTSATASQSPSKSAEPSGTKKPKPDSSLAPDGLPLVTIDQPERGASVNIPVQISGTAVAFEAVLGWEILDSNGKFFVNGPAYADAGAPERGRWQTEVELPIGSYTLVAYVESPKNGKRLAEAKVKFRAG